MKPAVLYLSYDGVLEPLGESQVLSYLVGLCADYDITLLSFEKRADTADSARVATMTTRLASRGITWTPLRYHKRPPVLSTAFDIVAGIRRARRIARLRSIRIIHARSDVAALIALGARRASDAAFLFDIRGFWVHEKVEAGHWKRDGLLFRIGKWWERRFYGAADAVVSLTAAGVRSLPELGVHVRPSVPIEVIPTCADLERFSPGPKDQDLMGRLGLRAGPVIGCVGTMGNWYLRQEMIDALGRFAGHWPELQILIVTRDDRDLLRRDLERAGVPASRLVLTTSDFGDMPRHIRLFDAGLFFIKSSFSKRASAATKMAEFLGCGVPVVINDGVGDSGSIVRDGRTGVVLSSLEPAAVDAALASLRGMIADPLIRKRCRDVAEDVFDLRVGIERYRHLYLRLLPSP